MGNSGSRSTVFGRSLRTSSSTNDSIKSNLAPTQKKSADDLEADSECPICFYNYEALNTTKCCKGNICTTCHLELITINKTAKPTTCPFCSSTNYCVAYSTAGVMSPAKNPNSLSTSLYMSSLTAQAPSMTFDQSGPKSVDSSNPTYIAKRSLVTRSLPIVLASVDDRKQIENEIMSQRRESGSNRTLSAVARSLGSNSSRSFSHSFESPPLSMLPSPYRPGQSVQNFRNHNEDSNNAQPNFSTISRESTTNEQQQINAFETLLQAFINGNNASLQGVNMEGYDDVERLEHLMLLQAIQMSLNDAPAASPAPVLDPVVEPVLSQLNANDGISASTNEVNSHEVMSHRAVAPGLADENKQGEFFEDLIQNSDLHTDSREIDSREFKDEPEHTDMWRPFDMDESFSHQPSSDLFTTVPEDSFTRSADFTRDKYTPQTYFTNHSAREVNNTLPVPDLVNNSASIGADEDLKPAAITTSQPDCSINEYIFTPTVYSISNSHKASSPVPFEPITEELKATKPTSVDSTAINNTADNVTLRNLSSFSNSSISLIERDYDESVHLVEQTMKKRYSDMDQESDVEEKVSIDSPQMKLNTAVLRDKFDEDGQFDSAVMKDTKAPLTIITSSSSNDFSDAAGAIENQLSPLDFPVSQRNCTTIVSDSVAAAVDDSDSGKSIATTTATDSVAVVVDYSSTGVVEATSTAVDSVGAVVDHSNIGVIEATTAATDSEAALMDPFNTYTDQADLLHP